MMEDDDVSDNDDSKRLKTNEGRMMIGTIMVVKEGDDSGNDNGG